MARNFTVAQLMARARAATDTETDANVVDSFLQTELATLYGTAYGTVVDSGLRYFETRASLTSGQVVGKPRELTAPADLYGVLGLDYLDAAGRRFELYEVQAQERAWFAQPTFSGPWARCFEHVGATFQLYPQPPANQTYEVWYIPNAPDLSAVATSTNVDVVTPDGERFLMCGMAAVIRERKEQDVTFFVNEREKALARLSSWSGRRAFLQPRRRMVESSEWSPDGWDRSNHWRERP